MVTIFGALQSNLVSRHRHCTVASAEFFGHDRVNGGGKFGWGHEKQFYRAVNTALRGVARRTRADVVAAIS